MCESIRVTEATFTEARDTTEIMDETLSIPGGLVDQDGRVSCSKGTETPASQSSSASAITQVSGTTDSDIAANMMSTVVAQDVYGKVLDFFSRFIEFKLRITGTQQRGGPSSKGNPRVQRRLTGIEGESQHQTAKRKGKRVFQEDDNFDDPSEAPDDEHPQAKRRKTEKLKIACPYMKRYPTEFCSWRTCVGPGFDGMNRMKYVFDKTV